MKVYKLIVWVLAGLFLLVGLADCSTPPKGPDTEQIRKRADEGMQDLQKEEERQKQ
jgi:hypothetical protein